MMLRTKYIYILFCIYLFFSDPVLRWGVTFSDDLDLFLTSSAQPVLVGKETIEKIFTGSWEEETLLFKFSCYFLGWSRCAKYISTKSLMLSIKFITISCVLVIYL